MHQTGESLQDELKSWLVPIGAFIAKCIERCVDEIGPDALHLFIAQPQPVHYAGPKVLDQDIAILYETPDDVNPFCLLEIDDDALFVSVDTKKVGTLTILKWRTNYTCAVPCSGDFNLYDLGAQVPEEHCSKRTGQQVGEIQHGDAI
jgi:hypothetical protein